MVLSYFLQQRVRVKLSSAKRIQISHSKGKREIFGSDYLSGVNATFKSSKKFNC